MSEQGPRRTSIRILAVAIYATFLAACDNGNSPGPVRRFFGTVNYGECRNLVVDVDLNAGRSTISRRQDDSLDCSLAEDLVARGCSVTFDDIGGGSQLEVTISSCTVPTDPVDLFSCLFQSIDEKKLETETSGSCSCATAPICSDNGPTCDYGPVICVGKSDGPGACETCENGSDDNGDRLVDCDDPECHYSNSCGLFGPNNTTITCSSSTSTTTVTTSTVTSSTVTTSTDPGVDLRAGEDLIATGVNQQCAVNPVAAPRPQAPRP